MVGFLSSTATVMALAISSPLAVMAQAPITSPSTSQTTSPSTTPSMTAPSTLVTSTSLSASCSLVTTINGYMLVTIQQCGTSETSLWTDYTGTSLLTVPSSVLYPPGTNTVTPWDVVQTIGPIYEYPDVEDPWAFPTPSPWPSSLLNPHWVGGGSKKDVEYSIPIGGIIAVCIALAVVLTVVGFAGFLLYRRQRSVRLGTGSVGMGLGKTLGKGLQKSDMVEAEHAAAQHGPVREVS